MAIAKEKNLFMALGLNLVLAGAGYLYMGKWLVGIAAFLLIAGIFATSDTETLAITWLVLNAIMAIDMTMLHRKNQKILQEQNTQKCPRCAELIQREAKVCRFCSAEVVSV